MRVLHYLPGLPPIMVGGMIKYALDLAHGEIKLGHEVRILVSGHFTHFHKNNTRIVRKSWKDLDCYRILNPLLVTGGKGIQDISGLIQKGDREVYTKFLEEIKPKIIHIHSFMGLHISFLEAAEQIGIPIVYTTHDYYGICPKAILLNGLTQCTITDGSQCPYCIEGAITTKKFKWQQSAMYEILKNNRFINYLEYSQSLVPLKIYIRSFIKKNNQQKPNEFENKNIKNIQQEQEYKILQSYYREMFQYVTRFHYNSTQSKEVFTQYLGNISGDVIPISSKNTSDRRKRRSFDKTLRIGFIGCGEYKGFHLLKDALDGLYAEGMRDMECHIYFNPREKMPSYMISHEPYKEEDIDRVYNNIDILILPSVWKETYGLVVLEALSYGIPFIVSQNVGAKELLDVNNGMGIVIKPTKKALQTALEKVYRDRRLLGRMNLEICSCKMQLNYEEHVCNIVDMYNNMVSSSERSKC